MNRRLVWLFGFALAVVAGVAVFLALNRSRAPQDPEATWKAAVAKNPNSAEARRNLANVFYGEGRLEEALGQYKEALRIEPNEPNTALQAANTLVALKRQPEAVPYYEQVVKLQPDNAEAHANLGVIMSNLGKADEALAHNRKAVELSPNHAKARVNLAVALAAKGEFEEAIQQYETALKLDPEQPMVHVNLAIALAVTGRLDDAAQHYAIAAKALNAAAQKLADEGKTEQAEAQYREALRCIPNNADAHYGLAMLLMSLGKPADARPHLNQALLIRPDFAEAKAALEKLKAGEK